MDRDPRGTISQQGNVMRIDNAFVEEVVPANRSSNGYLLVSYATAGANRTTSIQNLRLNITRNDCPVRFFRTADTAFRYTKGYVGQRCLFFCNDTQHPATVDRFFNRCQKGFSDFFLYHYNRTGCHGRPGQ